MRKRKIHHIVHEHGVGEVMREETAKKQKEERDIIGYLLRDKAAELMKRKR